MRSSLDKNYLLSEIISKYHLLLLSIIVIFIVFSTELNFKVKDTFHEGEYLGLLWHMIEYYKGNVIFPVLIHGSMDYLPGIIAKYIYGDDHVIVGTRLINVLLVCLAWILFLDTCRIITNKMNGNYLMHIFYLFLFLFLTPNFCSSALAIHEAFIGLRDVFLILTIWSLFRAILINDLNNISISYLILSCVSVVFGFFWSYDRGIMGIAFFFIFFLGLIIHKHYYQCFLSVLVIMGCLAILGILGIFGSIQDNIYNIIYWFNNSKNIFGRSIFYGGVRIGLDFVLFTIFIVSTISSAMLIFKNKMNKNWYQYTPFIIGLIIVQIILIKSISNRVGNPRTLWVIWPSLLIILYVLPVNFLSLRKNIINYSPFNFSLNYSIFEIKSITCLKFLILTGLFSLFLALSQSPKILHYYASFIKNSIFPQEDSALISEEVMDVAKNLNNNSCVFGWTNEGVIALLSRKPYCSWFTYLVYASRNYESEIIDSLKLTNPESILTDSAFWSFKIDQKSMNERLPIVGDFLAKNYTFKKRINDYEISTKEGLTK